MDKILLIDGMNQIWRANTKFGPPVNHQICLDCVNEKHNQDEIHCNCNSPWNLEENYCYGEKYIIVFNFFRNLRPLIEMFSPDKAFFVLEGHPQFRYDLYPEYKANRFIKQASAKSTKDLVFESKDIIVSLMQYLPFTICCAAQYEADDTISSLVEDMKEEDLTIISGDNDYIQLLQKDYQNLKIYSPIKKEYLKAPDYFFILNRCLAGDKSDNIQALLKPKKALETTKDPELLKKFLSVEENRANFSINRQLVEFRAVPMEEIEMTQGQANFDLLREKFSEMKFQSIVNDYSWDKYKNTFNCLKY